MSRHHVWMIEGIVLIFITLKAFISAGPAFRSHNIAQAFLVIILSFDGVDSSQCKYYSGNCRCLASFGLVIATTADVCDLGESCFRQHPHPSDFFAIMGICVRG